MAKHKTPAPAPADEPISESFISVGLGILVVVVVGILIYNYFTQKKPNPNAEKEAAEKIAEEATMSAKPGTTYTVQEGDDLWKIAEKSYADGYQWTLIARANDIVDSNQLEVGQKLVIPVLSSPTPEAVAQSTPAATQEPAPVAQATPASTPQANAPAVQPAITGATYTVVLGDNLWDISCRAYGDCYGWTKIAQANNLINPDVIHPGNVLNLPR